MDNVYECIEKLEMGRSHSHNGVHQETGPIGDIKEALCNIFIGSIGLLLYVLSAVQVWVIKKTTVGGRTSDVLAVKS